MLMFPEVKHSEPSQSSSTNEHTALDKYRVGTHCPPVYYIFNQVHIHFCDVDLGPNNILTPHQVRRQVRLVLNTCNEASKS